jgi:hypothetical protein
MFTTNVIFHHGKIKLFENISKPQWALKTAVLIQTDLIIFNDNFTETKENGKLKMLGIETSISKADSEWQINLHRDDLINSFLVPTLESAEQWQKMLTLAISWSNYERFCEFQKLKPWIFLLRWAARGSESLTINLTKCNGFALSEFFRHNTYIKELYIEDANNEILILSRLISSFTKTQLQSFALRNAEMTTKSLGDIRKIISHNNYLRRLDLAFNHFDSDCVKVLLKIFISTPFLEFLDLSGNKIADEGFAELAIDLIKSVPILELLLNSCDISDFSIQTVHKLRKIKNSTLEKLELSGNLFTAEGVVGMVKDFSKPIANGKMRLKIFPLAICEEIVKYIDDNIYVLKKCKVNKNSPIRHRGTFENLAKKIDKILENPFIEDLVEVINELSQSDIPFPRAKLEPIEKLVYDYLAIAVVQPSYYSLELLVPILKKLNLKHEQAEEMFRILNPEVEHIINTLENILSPDIYTEENIPEINSLLEEVIKRCDDLGIRGEIIEAAKILKNKRDELVRKRKYTKH